MTGRVFVDTNVLVYAYNRSEPAKQVQAFDVLERLVVNRAGMISTQVLGEFFTTTTRKIAAPLTIAEASERIVDLLRSWRVVDVTGIIVLEATRGVREHQLSYWDALIWATARLNQVTTIFSEDFARGAILDGVRVVSPFAADFRLEDWL